MSEARATLQLDGSIAAYRGSVDTTGDRVGDIDSVVKVTVTLARSLNGKDIDLTPPYELHHTQGRLIPTGLDYVTSVRFLTPDLLVEDCAWTISFLGKNDGDYVLENNEKALVTIWLVEYDYHPSVGLFYEIGNNESDPFIDDESYLLSTYDTFSLQVIPGTGAVLVLDKTVPAHLDAVMNLG